MTRSATSARGGPFEDDDFRGTADVAGQRDEAARLRVEVGQVGCVRSQRVGYGVHGDVAVMERAEVAGVCVAAVPAAPLGVLGPRLHTAVHDRGPGRGGGSDGGAQQCGTS